MFVAWFGVGYPATTVAGSVFDDEMNDRAGDTRTGQRYVRRRLADGARMYTIDCMKIRMIGEGSPMLLPQ